jgi:hypothetical protein
MPTSIMGADVQAELDKARVPGFKNVQVVRVDGGITQGPLHVVAVNMQPMEIQILGKKG